MPRARSSAPIIVPVVLTALVLALSAGPADADLLPGLLSDFEDGTLQGWDPNRSNTTNVASGGVPGLGDHVLEIAVSSATRISAHNTAVAGTIDPDVLSVEVDMMRPSGQTALEVRMVLMGPSTNDRWTSTVAAAVPGNGLWDTYSFSILEADLTQVLGGTTYDALAGGLNRLMFRHDAGTPSAQGTAGAAGELLIDNVFVVPEPAALALAAAAMVVLALVRARA